MPSQMSERERHYEFFETPPHYVAALLEHAPVRGKVLEPCSGDLAIARLLVQTPGVTKVVTNDIDPNRQADTHADATDPAFWKLAGGMDWIVTNMPFKHGLAITRGALKAGPSVALLARLSFLEPTEDRAELWETCPPTNVIVLPRHSFRCNDAGKRQTDNVTCAWLVWDCGQPGIRVIGRAQSMVAAAKRGFYE